MSYWINCGARCLIVSVVSSAVVACGSSGGKSLFTPPDGGVDGGVCLVSFDSLARNQTLTAEDDTDNDCSNGIQLDVELETNAASVELTVGDGDAETEDATAGVVTFSDITIPADGDTTLSVSVPGEAGCEATVTVSGNCVFEPSCEIAKPTDESLLNGVAAPMGDRVSDDGEPYATSVEVTTNAPDGEKVLLDTGAATPLAATVSAGVAEFPSVPLTPDGTFTLNAECENGNLSGFADALTVTVDTESPTLTADEVTPADGQHFSPDQDVDLGTPELEFEVCVPVESADALDIVGDNENNVCVAVGTQAGDCVPATKGGLPGGADGGCVAVACPGSAAIDLNVTVKDAAGNLSTHVIEGITCASAEPTVQIVAPADASNAPNDVSLRLLANSMPDPQLKDRDAVAGGAQTEVVACTNAVGGTAELFAGLTGSELTSIATLTTLGTPAQGECPAGLTAIARFSDVTLPESALTGTGQIDKNSELQVKVTDVSTEDNLSGVVRLWVDSAAPALRLNLPPGELLCDEAIDSQVAVAKSLLFTSSAFPEPVTVQVENGGVLGTAATTTGTGTPANVTFPLGANILRAQTTEPSGNVGTLAECSVLVGDVATIVWLAPAPTTTILNAQGAAAVATSVSDADAAAAGWQGTLSVLVTDLNAADITTGSIQFQVDGVDLGPPQALSAAVGDATSRTVTLDTASLPGGVPEGISVTLRAQLVGVTLSVGRSITDLVVDTIAPGAVSNVVPAVGPNPEDRRWTRFLVSWDAAGDGSAGADTVAGYRIAYSPNLIDDQAKFDAAFADANPLTIPGGLTLPTPPQAPGNGEQTLVGDLRIERPYFFAVQAFDAGGNLGPVGAGDSGDAMVGPAVQARFKAMILRPPSDVATQFGAAMDGSTDLTGDGLSDFVVGSGAGNKVYIFKGEATGINPTPLVTISGPTGVNFGLSAVVVGDVNKDLPANPSAVQLAQSHDLVITAFTEPDVVAGGVGRAYVFFGRDWELPANANLSIAGNDHDAVIGSEVSTFFQAASHVGDFNNDGADDFALTMPSYNTPSAGTLEGGVTIVLGSTVANTFESFTIPSAPAGRAIVINGESTAVGFPAALLFGLTLGGSHPIVGWGRIFGGAAGTGIAVASPFKSTLFGFNNASAGTGAMLHTQAVDTFNGPANSFTGNFGIALSADFVTAVSNPDHKWFTDATREGSVNVFASSAADLFPAAPLQLVDSSVNVNFGQVLVGNAFSGRPGSYGTRMLGDPTQTSPDLMVSSPTLTPTGGAGTGVPTIHILSGSRVQNTTGQLNLAASTSNHDVAFSLLGVPGVRAPVVLPAPGGWLGSLGTGLRDIDGDGYMDFAIAEYQRSGTFDGEIIILY